MTNQNENLKASEIETVKAKAEALKVPFINLAGKEIPVEVLKEIPEEAAAFYRFIPLARRENILEIGMIDPGDPKAKEALRFIIRQSGLETKLFIISPTDFKNVLKQYRTLRGEVKKALEELAKELEAEERVKPLEGKAEEIAKQIVTEAPITKIVAVILRHAIEGRASDIHIEPVKDKIKVRFRVDGILYTGLLLPKEIQGRLSLGLKYFLILKLMRPEFLKTVAFIPLLPARKLIFGFLPFRRLAEKKLS